MSRPKTIKAETKPRYTPDSARLEIRRVIDQQKKNRGLKKRLAIAAGIDSSGFTHRLNGRPGYTFSIEEIGSIAEEAKGPTGWPWVPWEIGEAFDAYRRMVAAANPPRKQQPDPHRPPRHRGPGEGDREANGEDHLN